MAQPTGQVTGVSRPSSQFVPCSSQQASCTSCAKQSYCAKAQRQIWNQMCMWVTGERIAENAPCAGCKTCRRHPADTRPPSSARKRWTFRPSPPFPAMSPPPALEWPNFRAWGLRATRYELGSFVHGHTACVNMSPHWSPTWAQTRHISMNETKRCIRERSQLVAEWSVKEVAISYRKARRPHHTPRCSCP